MLGIQNDDYRTRATTRVCPYDYDGTYSPRSRIRLVQFHQNCVDGATFTIMPNHIHSMIVVGRSVGASLVDALDDDDLTRAITKVAPTTAIEIVR